MRTFLSEAAAQKHHRPSGVGRDIGSAFSHGIRMDVRLQLDIYTGPHTTLTNTP